MKNMINVMLVCFSVFMSVYAFAEESKSVKSEPYVHSTQVYPPVLFVTNIEGDEFKEKFKSYNAFSKIDSEQLGLPIGIRVLKGLRMKGDGTSFSTLMFSAATLGLTPIVSNKVFKVRYDVFVQGKSIAKYQYEMTSTDVENIWSGALRDSTKLKPAEQLFLEGSIDMFMTEMSATPEVMAVFEEYRKYFGDS